MAPVAAFPNMSIHPHACLHMHFSPHLRRVCLGVLLLCLAVPYGAAASDSAQQFQQAQRMHARLDGKLTTRRTRADYNRVMNAYRSVYMENSGSPYAVAAMAATAALYAEEGRVFHDPVLLHYAIRQYEALRRRYPGSEQAYSALLNEGEIYELDLRDLARARPKLVESAHDVSDGGLAVALADQWRERRQPFQALWAVGMLFYGIASGCEALAAAMDTEPDPKEGWGKLVDGLFAREVEPTLIQPTFVLDYPVELGGALDEDDVRAQLVEGPGHGAGHVAQHVEVERAAGVDDHAHAGAATAVAVGDLEGEVLDGVDRLAVAPDEQPEILALEHAADRLVRDPRGELVGEGEGGLVVQIAQQPAEQDVAEPQNRQAGVHPVTAPGRVPSLAPPASSAVVSSVDAPSPRQSWRMSSITGSVSAGKSLGSSAGGRAVSRAWVAPDSASIPSAVQGAWAADAGRQHRRARLDDGGGGLVTRRLDTQHQHASTFPVQRGRNTMTDGGGTGVEQALVRVLVDVVGPHDQRIVLALVVPGSDPDRTEPEPRIQPLRGEVVVTNLQRRRTCVTRTRHP